MGSWWALTWPLGPSCLSTRSSTGPWQGSAVPAAGGGNHCVRKTSPFLLEWDTVEKLLLGRIHSWWPRAREPGSYMTCQLWADIFIQCWLAASASPPARKPLVPVLTHPRNQAHIESPSTWLRLTFTWPGQWLWDWFKWKHVSPITPSSPLPGFELFMSIAPKRRLLVDVSACNLFHNVSPYAWVVLFPFLSIKPIHSLIQLQTFLAGFLTDLHQALPTALQMIRISDPLNLRIQFSHKIQRQGSHIRILWRAELLFCSRKPPSFLRNEMLLSVRSALHRTPQLSYFPKATEWTRNGAKNLTQLPGSIPCLPWAQNHALFTQNTELVALLNNGSFLIHFSLTLLSTAIPEVLLSLLKLHVFYKAQWECGSCWPDLGPLRLPVPATPSPANEMSPPPSASFCLPPALFRGSGVSVVLLQEIGGLQEKMTPFSLIFTMRDFLKIKSRSKTGSYFTESLISSAETRKVA